MCKNSPCNVSPFRATVPGFLPPVTTFCYKVLFSTYFLFGILCCDRYYCLPYVSNSFLRRLISVLACICSRSFIISWRMSVRIDPIRFTPRVVRTWPVRIALCYFPLSRFLTMHYVICRFPYYVYNCLCFRYVSVVSCRLVAQLMSYQFPHSYYIQRAVRCMR